MSDIKNYQLTGLAKWASILKPKKTFDGDGEEYSIDVAITAKDEKALREMGMSAKTKVKVDADTGLNYLTFRRPTVAKSGAEMLPLVVVGRNLEPVTDLIGNGSEVAVKLSLIPYDNKFGKGAKIYLNAVQVIQHVSYESKATAGGFAKLDEDTSGGFAAVQSDEDII